MREEILAFFIIQSCKGAFLGSVAKRCGHSLYTILNILAFDFSVLFVGYSLIGNISLTFFVAQRTKRPARE